MTKFGGTSVADPDKIKDVARRLVAARTEGNRVVAVLSAMGDSTDDLVRLAYEVSPRPKPRELDMLISVGERISCALAAMAIHDLGAEAISLTGSQAGIVTDTVPRARQDRRRPRAPHPRGARPGQDRPRRGLSGRLHRLRHHDARPRRLRHDRRRPGRRARRRGLRDLHRRRRRLHRRPAPRAGSAQAARGQLRGDARDGGLGRASAPGTLGRGRAEPPRQAARPLHVLDARTAPGFARRTNGCSRRR